MGNAHAFLEALALVLGAAAITSVMFQRLRQPIVLGYVLAGLIVGPYTPIPVIADHEIVETLSELGVILLMFSLGLEFSLRKLFEVGFTAGLTALVETSIQLWLGFMVGRALGWSVRESIFCGAMVAISSTTIIAKAFTEQGVQGQLRTLVVGVLIVEDLIAILLMAVLTAMSASGTLSWLTLAHSSGRLAAFLGGLLIVGMLIVPRGIRGIASMARPEITLVASVGICFIMAYVARKFGYSVALGAFLAGSLIAESGVEKEVERLIEPVRDMFGAIFFVSVGMTIDPIVIMQHWHAIALLTLVVLAGKIVGVSAGAFLTGAGLRLSLRSGLSLAQVGEFSFIIASLGQALGATRGFIYPMIVAVSAATTLTTPWLIRGSERAAGFVERRMPQSWQSFAALYTSWLERLQTSTQQRGGEVGTRRFVRLLALDAVLLGALVIGSALYADAAVLSIERKLSVSSPIARGLAAGAVIALAAPLCVGISSVVRHLVTSLAEAALPAAESGKHELGRAARSALVITLQLAIVLLVGLPLLAVTQPFISGPGAAVLLMMTLAMFGVLVLRRVASLQGEVRAGTQLIVATLASGSVAPSSLDASEGVGRGVQRFLADLGEPRPVRLDPQHAAVGKTLVALDVRGATGATVLAIAREAEGAIVPTGREILRVDDVLVLAGTQRAVDDARRLLHDGRLASGDDR
jgi:monovalent cation:H+ antiporter-2, CPA2 family